MRRVVFGLQTGLVPVVQFEDTFMSSRNLPSFRCNSTGLTYPGNKGVPTNEDGDILGAWMPCPPCFVIDIDDARILGLSAVDPLLI